MRLRKRVIASAKVSTPGMMSLQFAKVWVWLARRRGQQQVAG
ncbi:MAG: hypothetical protein DWQ42_05650 [Planctomycetota bacterium]|nr:MAG: hypothetical protein DWQ42_05650 [Planctomycetota bacterium]REK42458.1 MAG: hypothetical protein DWQ46_13290 [Planctomycetota bacterium]